ncbi:MAG: ATP-binding protein [Rhodospirillaceae bacterium]
MRTGKWRPTLSMVVAAMIGTALLLPLSGVLLFRLYEDQLVRNTEAELIAQSAALAAMMSTTLSREDDGALPLGPEVPPRFLAAGEHWSPILPQLSLSEATILPERPDAVPTDAAPSQAYQRLAERLDPILMQTQQATLAGFRILDFKGTVIAGRPDIGLSFADLPEVQEALGGQYRSVLRDRAPEDPMPIYSISRGTGVRVFTAMPVVVRGQLAGVVYASRTPSNVVKEFYFLRDRLALVAVALLALAGVMVLIFSRAIAGPILLLRRRARLIGQGDRAAIGPLRHHGSREVFELSNALMDTAAKLFKRNDYINSFAAHVSHELKSPLTSIRGAVELLKDGGMTEAEQAKFLDNIERDVERGSLLLDRLRALAKADTMEVGGTCDLMDVVAALKPTLPTLAISLSGPTALPLSAEAAKIVLGNLLDNAAQQGATTVAFTVVSADGGLHIDVQDNGPGVSPGNAQRIFDLFFTTRRETGGTGLGLGIVRSLLEAHGATIALLEREEGAHFRISGLVAEPEGKGV